MTWSLIAANVAVFLTEPLAASAVAQTRFFVCRASIPFEVVNRTLSPQIPYEALGCPNKSVWISILSSMFLHGGLLHIAGNMLFLWVFGNNVEDRFGRVGFLGFYLAAGLAATLAQSYLSADSLVPLIGASGAVAGVLGAYLVMFPRARVTTLLFYFVLDLPAVVVLAGWFVMQVFQGVGSIRGAAGGVAYFAHIGGFVVGVAVAALLAGRRRSPPEGSWS